MSGTAAMGEPVVSPARAAIAEVLRDPGLSNEDYQYNLWRYKTVAVCDMLIELVRTLTGTRQLRPYIEACGLTMDEWEDLPSAEGRKPWPEGTREHVVSKGRMMTEGIPWPATT